MGIDFDSLTPALSKAALEAPDARPKHSLHKIRKAARARLVAQEFVRNGMNLVAAYRTVVGKKYAGKGTSIMSIMGESTDVFVEELSRIIDKSDISRDRALSILWTMINTSILDFIDDNGNVLPIAELRKLPRVVQLMISKIEVTVSQKEVRDAKGNPMLDDNGSPFMATSQRVKIEVPERMAALMQLAQIMRWVGPTTVINNINLGRLMSDADARASRAEIIYDAATGKLDQG